MGCAMDPSTSAPAIAQAQKAGIVVGVYGGTPHMDQRAGTTYNTDDPYALDAKLAAEQAIEQHNGQPFNAIAITSTATGPATVIEEDSIQATLAKDCPKCTLTAVNVEVPDWQTQIASTVTSQLLQHPNVSVLFPDYAGELTYVLAGIQAAHRTDVKTYLAFGGGTPFVQLQTASPGKDIIQSDVSESPPWTGYLLFLQAIRGLEKLPPISYAQAIGPDLIITPDNAVSVLTTGGFGDDWVNGFRAAAGAARPVGQRAARGVDAERRDDRQAVARATPACSGGAVSLAAARRPHDREEACVAVTDSGTPGESDKHVSLRNPRHPASRRRRPRLRCAASPRISAATGRWTGWTCASVTARCSGCSGRTARASRRW